MIKATGDKADREALKLVEKHAGVFMAFEARDDFQNDVAAHFRNYEIEIAMLKTERRDRQDAMVKIGVELGVAKSDLVEAIEVTKRFKELTTIIGGERAALIGAINRFRSTAGTHEGDHTMVHSDGAMVGKPCALCDESYIRAEQELDTALAAVTNNK
jgi:hypothetical protein